jgi:acyl-CoA thioester hydrolase
MGTHADLELRRSAPLPDSIAEALDAKLEKDRALTWEAPACGVIKL